MKIHVIATPRSGATAYAENLASNLGCLFINEPFKFANFYNKTNISGTDFGGGIPQDVDNYVAHHIVSQYLFAFDPSVVDKNTKLIFITRRDRWKQMLSYLAAVMLHKKYGWHNISYEPETIHVPQRFMQRLVHDWVAFDLLTAIRPEIQVLYYEDMILPNKTFKKNLGSSKIKFKNLSQIKAAYNMYHRNTDKK